MEIDSHTKDTTDMVDIGFSTRAAIPNHDYLVMFSSLSHCIHVLV